MCTGSCRERIMQLKTKHRGWIRVEKAERSRRIRNVAWESEPKTDKEITPLSYYHQRPTTQDPRSVLLKSSTYRYWGALFSHRLLEPELQKEKKSCVENVTFFIHLEKNCNYLGIRALVGPCFRSWLLAEGSLHLGDSSSCRWGMLTFATSRLFLLSPTWADWHSLEESHSIPKKRKSSSGVTSASHHCWLLFFQTFSYWSF